MINIQKINVPFSLYILSYFCKKTIMANLVTGNMSQKSSQRSCCFVASQTNNMAFAAEWQPCSNQSLQHGKGTGCYELLFERVMDSTRIAAVSFHSKKRTKKKKPQKNLLNLLNIFFTYTGTEKLIVANIQVQMFTFMRVFTLT